MAEAQRALIRGSTHVYSPAPGLPSLRELLAQRLVSSHGIDGRPSEIAITAGRNQAGWP